jgi:hypothetical protein
MYGEDEQTPLFMIKTATFICGVLKQPLWRTAIFLRLLQSITGVLLIKRLLHELNRPGCSDRPGIPEPSSEDGFAIRTIAAGY